MVRRSSISPRQIADVEDAMHRACQRAERQAKFDLEEIDDMQMELEESRSVVQQRLDRLRLLPLPLIWINQDGTLLSDTERRNRYAEG